jgi:hypothetical protein
LCRLLPSAARFSRFSQSERSERSAASLGSALRAHKAELRSARKGKERNAFHVLVSEHVNVVYEKNQILNTMLIC